MSRTKYKTADKKFSNISAKKRLDIKQFEEERRLTEQLVKGVDKMNAIAFDPELFQITLTMDERPYAKDTFDLDSTDKKILRKYADPGCFDILEIVKDAVVQANKRLRSFKYRLAIEWAKKGGVS